MAKDPMTATKIERQTMLYHLEKTKRLLREVGLLDVQLEKKLDKEAAKWRG